TSEPQLIFRQGLTGMRRSSNSPRSLLRRGKLSSPSNLKTDRARNLRPRLRELFSKTACEVRKRMVLEWFDPCEAELGLLPWREKARMREHNRHPHLHSLPSRERKGIVGRLCLGMALAALSATGMGCMGGPDYVRPAVEQPLRFTSQAGSGEAPLIAREWWRLYSDPVLDQLIASAQASNQTLRQAVARVDQAGALALVAVSFLSPTISLDP